MDIARSKTEDIDNVMFEISLIRYYFHINQNRNPKFAKLEQVLNMM